MDLCCGIACLIEVGVWINFGFGVRIEVLKLFGVESGSKVDLLKLSGVGVRIGLAVDFIFTDSATML